MQVQKLLIAVDLNDECLEILKRVNSLGLPQSVEIHLVHVVEHVSLFPAFNQLFSNDEGSLEKMKVSALERLELMKRGLGLDRYQKVTLQCLIAPNAKQEFLEYAYKFRPDLIVTASHERKGYKGVFEGSFNNFLSRFSPYDILIFRPKV